MPKMFSCSGLTSAAGGSGDVVMEIIAGANKGFWLKRITFMASTAVACQLSVRRASTKGVTPTTTALPGVYPAGETVEALYATAWGGARPVVTGMPLYCIASVGATIGDQATFDFTSQQNQQCKGIFVPANASITVFSHAATGVAWITAICEEQ